MLLLNENGPASGRSKNTTPETQAPGKLLTHCNATTRYSGLKTTRAPTRRCSTTPHGIPALATYVQRPELTCCYSGDRSATSGADSITSTCSGGALTANSTLGVPYDIQASSFPGRPGWQPRNNPTPSCPRSPSGRRQPPLQLCRRREAIGAVHNHFPYPPRRRL